MHMSKSQNGKLVISYMSKLNFSNLKRPSNRSQVKVLTKKGGEFTPVSGRTGTI